MIEFAVIITMILEKSCVRGVVSVDPAIVFIFLTENDLLKPKANYCLKNKLLLRNIL